MSGRKVGSTIGEAILYGIAKALDDSGLQARVILEDVGKTILDTLIEKGAVKRSEDPLKMIKQLADYFSSTGLLASLEVTKDADRIRLEWKSWRLLPVVQTLSKNGSNLLPCPLTLAISAIFRGQGYTLEPVSEISLDRAQGNASQTFRLVHVKKNFEEEAERISREMDRALDLK